MTATAYTTQFGSLERFEKGGVQVIDDDVKHYAFSNCFEIASKAAPYEKVVFGQNQIYVLEALRAEGSSPWYTCAHDEFALVMDGEVEIHLVQLSAEQAVPDTEHNGAVLVQGEPRGRTAGVDEHLAAGRAEPLPGAAGRGRQHTARTSLQASRCGRFSRQPVVAAASALIACARRRIANAGRGSTRPTGWCRG